MKLKLTNKLGLPEPIIAAIRNDSYDSKGSDYTATSLLRPPRAGELARTVGYSEDASDRIAALHGQAMHSVLERAGRDLIKQGYIVEERFVGVIKVNGKDFKVSAQIDLFDENRSILSDYKTALVSHVKHGLKEEHRLQVNLQALLLSQVGIEVKKAEVVLFLKDWSPMRAGYTVNWNDDGSCEISGKPSNNGYPPSAALKFEVPLMRTEEIYTWVIERIALHEAAKKDLPFCTKDEKWNRPDFAVIKEGNKKATKVFENKEEAEKFLDTVDKKLYSIKERGENIRCKFYCPVRFVCQQAKDEGSIVEQVDSDGLILIK